jgi:hypothetical protein
VGAWLASIPGLRGAVRPEQRWEALLLSGERDVLVADGVVFSLVHEVLVDRLGDHVVLVAVRA